MSRLRRLICTLRLLALSTALEDEWKPEVRWVGELPDRPVRHPSRHVQRETPYPLSYCRYQSNPKDDRHCPNYWENRMQRTEPSPNRSAADYDPDLTPAENLERLDGSWALPNFGDFEFDTEAVGYPSQLNPAPQRDALQTWQRLFEMSETMPVMLRTYKFRMGADVTHSKLCESCENWENLPTAANSRRPPGPIDRYTCNGCIVSHLDFVGDADVDQKRDAAYTAWTEAKDAVKEHNRKKHDAQTPGQKKAWVRENDEKKKHLAEAVELCKAAGIKVGAKQWMPTEMMGQPPEYRFDEVPLATPADPRRWPRKDVHYVR